MINFLINEIIVFLFFRHNRGHVTRTQLRQILTSMAILLSSEEVFTLERRYNDDLGFNYIWFLQEVEARPIEEPLYHQMLEDKKRINAEKPLSEPHEDETNIVLILAKIKAKVVRERIKVIHHNLFIISQLERRII